MPKHSKPDDIDKTPRQPSFRLNLVKLKHRAVKSLTRKSARIVQRPQLTVAMNTNPYQTDLGPAVSSPCHLANFDNTEEDVNTSPCQTDLETEVSAPCHLANFGNTEEDNQSMVIDQDDYEESIPSVYHTPRERLSIASTNERQPEPSIQHEEIKMVDPDGKSQAESTTTEFEIFVDSNEERDLVEGPLETEDTKTEILKPVELTLKRFDISYIPINDEAFSANQPANRSTGSRFLDLPFKIRMAILRYCIPDGPLSLARTRQLYRQTTKRWFVSEKGNDHPTRSCIPALFIVNWMLHYEYTQVFYKNAWFCLDFPQDYKLIQEVEDAVLEHDEFQPYWMPAFKVADFKHLLITITVNVNRKERTYAQDCQAVDFIGELRRIRGDVHRRILIDLSAYVPETPTKRQSKPVQKPLRRTVEKKSDYHSRWANVIDDILYLIKLSKDEVLVQFWKSSDEDHLPPVIRPSRFDFVAKCDKDNVDVGGW